MADPKAFAYYTIAEFARRATRELLFRAVLGQFSFLFPDSRLYGGCSERTLRNELNQIQLSCITHSFENLSKMTVHKTRA